MTRPDLKSDCDGWQASDPTPQEKSQGNERKALMNPQDHLWSRRVLTKVALLLGVYRCGPISVKAIKEGELTFRYDAPFVFAEVNADVITYMKKNDGTTSKVTSTAVVGQKISTKSVGSDAREDITHLYKYPEGRAEQLETLYM